MSDQNAMEILCVHKNGFGLVDCVKNWLFGLTYKKAIYGALAHNRILEFFFLMLWHLQRLFNRPQWAAERDSKRKTIVLIYQ